MALNGNPERKLPMVIVSTVVRSSYKGQRHGSVHLINMETEDNKQVIDCNTKDINWEGSGGERGLRGMCFYKDDIYLASHDTIFIYNKRFDLLSTITNKYFGQIHEIYTKNDILWITSTSFDSVIEYDLLSKTFTRGFCIRCLNFKRSQNYRKPKNKYLKYLHSLKNKIIRPKIDMHVFDPNADQGPVRSDQYHINNVYFKNSLLYISPSNSNTLLKIKDEKIVKKYRLPSSTHNAFPYKEGFLANNTANKKISYFSKEGKTLEAFNICQYDKGSIINIDIPGDKAKAFFARGLTVSNQGYIIAGSSPATVSLYEHGCKDPIKSVNISMDVRYAIHGLEIWPF